jgi:hypothetical protein
MARGSKPGERRGGRKKGIPNKITANVREAIEMAFTGVGGHKYLMEQAKQNPTAFMTLLGKVLPTQITGAGGGPIQTLDLSRVSNDDLDRLESVLSRIAGSVAGPETGETGADTPSS